MKKSNVLKLCLSCGIFLNSVTTFAQESSTIIHNKNGIILKLNGDQKGNFELVAENNSEKDMFNVKLLSKDIKGLKLISGKELLIGNLKSKEKKVLDKKALQFKIDEAVSEAIKNQKLAKTGIKGVGKILIPISIAGLVGTVYLIVSDKKNSKKYLSLLIGAGILGSSLVSQNINAKTFYDHTENVEGIVNVFGKNYTYSGILMWNDTDKINSDSDKQNSESSVVPNPTPKEGQSKLADKPADGIWYGTAFEGYGPDQYGASIVKVEIKAGKINSVEAIKHSASDVEYINRSKNILPLFVGKNASDLDSIIAELSNGDLKNKGTYADTVTAATRTARGYAIAIKKAVERARKFEFDKKEQKIAYIKITGENVNRPDTDRLAIADKSNLRNGTNADFDFVKYDIVMSDGSVKKGIKFSELKNYGIISDFSQNQMLDVDKDHIILTVKDETGYAVESIRLKVNPKIEKIKVRPTHALITFEKSGNTEKPDTEKIEIQAEKFVYDNGKIYDRKIEKVELFKGDKLIKKGEFRPGFNFWWFEIKDEDYKLGDNEKWEFNIYRVVTRMAEQGTPKPEAPKPSQPHQEIKDYYPAKYIFKDKETKETVAEIDIKEGEWKGSYSKNIKKEILKRYEGKLDKDSFEVEVLNKENQQLKVKSVVVLNKKMHGIETEVAEGEEYDKRTLNVFWDFKLENSPKTEISDFTPVKYIFKDKKTKETVVEIKIEENGWEKVPYSKNINNIEIPKKYENDLNKDSFEVEVFNKENQKIEVKSINVMSGGNKKMHEVKTAVSKEEEADERTLHVFWKFKSE